MFSVGAFQFKLIIDKLATGGVFNEVKKQAMHVTMQKRLEIGKFEVLYLFKKFEKHAYNYSIIKFFKKTYWGLHCYNLFAAFIR